LKISILAHKQLNGPVTYLKNLQSDEQPWKLMSRQINHKHEVNISLARTSDKLGSMNKINLLSRFGYHSIKSRPGQYERFASVLRASQGNCLQTEATDF